MHPLRIRFPAGAALLGFVATLAFRSATAGAPPDSGWHGPGLLVCGNLNAQERTVLASSSDGAYLVAWQDGRYLAAEPDVYVQKLLGDGTLAPGWPAGGAICALFPGSQRAPQICSDGAGGVLVTWEDDRTGGIPRIYAHHLSSAGLPVSGWPANGRPLTTVSAIQLAPRLVPDGAGGALVFWVDYRRIEPRLYAQHLTAGGNYSPGWPDTGRAIAPVAAGGQVSLAAISDGGTGAFVTWCDGRNGGGTSSDVYAQRVQGNGAPAAGWPARGVAVCTANGAQDRPGLALDGTGGVVLAWTDPRAGTYNIYAQRLTGLGAVNASWPPDGAAVSTAAPGQFDPAVTSDGLGGALVAWVDARGGPGNADLYAQRMDAGGSPLWLTDGVAVSAAPGDQLAPRVIHDGTGGAMICWQDARLSPETRLFAQHVTAAGALALGWPIDGRMIADSNLVVEAAAMIPDGAGGAICAWSGSEVPEDATGDDVYAARFTGEGVVPALASLAAAEASPHAVSLRWQTAWAGELLAVERATGARAGEAGWERQGEVRAAAGGEVEWRDESVVAGERYGYRLRGAAGVAGEAWVEVPRAQLAMARRGGGDRVTLAISLASAAPASLDLFDVAGRCRRHSELVAGALTQEIAIETGGLEPGIYVARLRQAAERATLRLAITR